MKKTITTKELLAQPYIGNVNTSRFLNEFRSSVFSQCGEDGVIQELLKRIGDYNKYYVEFGAWDGLHLSNTANLRENYQWEGLLLEGEASKVMGKEDRVQINLQEEFVTTESINPIFEKYNVPDKFGFLSVDIDSADIYVWEALSNKYRPDIVIIEFNPGLPNSFPVRTKLELVELGQRLPEFIDGGYNGGYFNANLSAVYDMALLKDYAFVTTIEWNAVFVRSELSARVGCENKTKNKVMEQHGMVEGVHLWRGWVGKNPEDLWLIWEDESGSTGEGSQDASPLKMDLAILRDKANESICSGDKEAAARCMEALSAAAPNDSHTHLLSGCFQELMDDLDSALSSYNLSIQASPGFYEASFAKAKLLTHLDRYNEAEEILGSLLKLVPRNPLSDYMFGKIFLKTARYEWACGAFETAISKSTGIGEFVHLYDKAKTQLKIATEKKASQT